MRYIELSPFSGGPTFCLLRRLCYRIRFPLHPEKNDERCLIPISLLSGSQTLAFPSTVDWFHLHARLTTPTFPP